MKKHWAYLEAGVSKHLLLSAKSKVSLCDVTTEHYNFISWQKDPATLSTRPSCKKCDNAWEKMR